MGRGCCRATTCKNDGAARRVKEREILKFWNSEASQGEASPGGGDVENKGGRRKMVEGVAEKRQLSFNFLLASAWAANSRLRARFDRKEGRKEGREDRRLGEDREGGSQGKKRLRSGGIARDEKKEINSSPCDLHAMNFQFDRTPFDASRRSRLD